MTDDIELQYANNPVLKGAAVKDMFSKTFEHLDLMEHKIVYFDFVAPKIYQAARIRYRVKGDDESQDIEIPGFATFFVRNEPDGSLKCYRAETYLDPSQLFARIAEKSAGST
jgi:ketosteroid isomerase-like protein